MIDVIQNGEVYEISFPYDADIVSHIKNIPTRYWHQESKIWTIPTNMLGFFINEFKGTSYEQSIRIVSSEQLNVNASLDSTSEIPDVDISKVKMYCKAGSKPYKHQYDFMKWALYRQLCQKNMSGFILSDDPGLGKTSEVMNLALYNRRNNKFKHCLIICCINSAKYNWIKDIEEHTQGQEIPYLLGTRLTKKGTPKKDISSKEKLEDLLTGHMYGNYDSPELPYFLVVNIEAFRQREGKHYVFTKRVIEMILSGDINMIAIDEIHKNASPSSTHGQQLLHIKKSTGQRAMWIPITGTPIVNQPTDVFTSLRLIDGHNYNSFYMWSKKYCIYAGYNNHDIVGYKNMSELKSVLQVNMLRRLKEDVLDLPPIVHTTIYVDNTSYQRKLYSEVAQDIQNRKYSILESMNPLVEIMKLRQVNGSPELVDTECKVDKSYINKNAKLKELIRLLHEIHERGEKVVIFSNWVEPLRTLYRFISTQYKTCCFTGTMSVSERENNKNMFINDPSYTVLLGTVGAAGVSHTFTVARNVIFYDEPWTYADKQQAWERIYRIGTKSFVNCYTLISRNTVDDKVHDIVYTKKKLSTYIVDGKIDIRKNPDLFDLLLSDSR